MIKYDSERHSFLLRLWKDSEHGEWRISIKDLITLETFHFPDLTSFIFYLKNKTGKYGAYPANSSDKETNLYKIKATSKDPASKEKSHTQR